MEGEDETVTEFDGGWEFVNQKTKIMWLLATNDDPIPIPWSWGPPIIL